MRHRETVNVLQACKLTGKSRRTIYYWLRKGKIQGWKQGHSCTSLKIFVDTLPRKDDEEFPCER